ncbi:hypothetical protein [Peribacillus muralis]|uniref:hypothetical protein n=1 Tax=Peribacillus muralis TaxID=264697 RepID=UPI00070DB7A8|nr:hypothetical protein [Peribacillus muralis]
METVLLVGKGKLFKAVEGSLYASHTDTSNVQILDYEEEWCKPLSNLGECYELIGNKIANYKIVYLFPDSPSDGISLMEIFSMFKPFRLFVVTLDQQYSSLYKKLGADLVIFSKADCYSYNWLLTSDEVFSM